MSSVTPPDSLARQITEDGSSAQRRVAYAAVVVVTALSWAFLLVLAAGMAGEIEYARTGPGMAFFTGLFELAEHPVLRQLTLSICAPFSQTASLAHGGTSWLAGGFLLPMWMVMSIAMMLPAAMPMLKTYLDIAETGHTREIAVPPAAFLVAGYLAIWVLFAVVAALLQSVLLAQGALTSGLVLDHPIAQAGVLAGAGLFQLSGLKHACLVKCRTPLPYFLTRWSNRALGVFKLGAGHGVACLACCWALMLVMFVAGLMNVVWMAVLTILLLLEKTVRNPAPLTLTTGWALLAWAGIVLGNAWI